MVYDIPAANGARINRWRRILPGNDTRGVQSCHCSAVLLGVGWRQREVRGSMVLARAQVASVTIRNQFHHLVGRTSSTCSESCLNIIGLRVPIVRYQSSGEPFGFPTHPTAASKRWVECFAAKSACKGQSTVTIITARSVRSAVLRTIPRASVAGRAEGKAVRYLRDGAADLSRDRANGQNC